MKSVYPGDTAGKKVTRPLVWPQHKRLLGSDFFRTAHLFLASRVAGDADTLKTLGVDNDLIWAVEKNEAEYRQLLDRKPAFRVFTRKIETVVEEYAKQACLRSVYLDFCGNLEGEASAVRRVVSRMPENSVVSITLFLGRELKELVRGNREAALSSLVREHSRHKVTLVQSVRYQSDDDTSVGSPMGIWTYALGSGLVSSRSVMRFDITPSRVDVKSLAASPKAIRALWLEEQRRSERQSLAAVKANQVRR